MDDLIKEFSLADDVTTLANEEGEADGDDDDSDADGGVSR